jgi:hypothetical protein
MLYSLEMDAERDLQLEASLYNAVDQRKQHEEKGNTEPTVDVRCESPDLGRLQGKEIDQEKDKDAYSPPGESMGPNHHNGCRSVS